MARARADVDEAELLQQRPDIAFAIIDPEAAVDDPLKIDATPAHDAVEFPVRSGLDDRGKFGLVFCREARIGACAYRKSNPAILTVQSAQDWMADNASGCLGGA